MKTYRVGGSVRDELLGLPVKDRDWVVVGATPEQMSAAGYLPVGKDFPVFLHPETREEYALARTERKTARGYKGFAIHTSPEVTLEEDLARRDLTINSIAVHGQWTLGNGQNHSNIDWMALALAATAAVALLRFKVGVIPVIATSALAGLALRLGGLT